MNNVFSVHISEFSVAMTCGTKADFPFYMASGF